MGGAPPEQVIEQQDHVGDVHSFRPIEIEKRHVAAPRRHGDSLAGGLSHLATEEEEKERHGVRDIDAAVAVRIAGPQEAVGSGISPVCLTRTTVRDGARGPVRGKAPGFRRSLDLYDVERQPLAVGLGVPGGIVDEVEDVKLSDGSSA